MTLASWRLALRLARRDALRSKARSLLVVALIGLPILILGVVDIGYRTYELSPAEKLSRGIGTADAGVKWSGLSSVEQGSTGWLGSSSGSGNGQTPAPTTAQLAAALPPGSRLIEWRVGTVPLTFRTRAGLAQATFAGLDVGDPLARGLVSRSSGRAPRAAGEVALTQALAAATGLHVGDLLRATDPVPRTYRVVGIVADGGDRSARAVYALPAQVPVVAARVLFEEGQIGWLAATPRPVRWATVQVLNRIGLSVVSRSEYLHPSAAARAADRATETGTNTYVAPLALVGGMALLEVVLLAGPAFAVSAKRRRRDLALIAAVGGTARELRRVVLCSGVVLGLAAGIVGVVGALVLTALGEPLIAPHVSTRPGHFDVRPWELLGLLGVGLLAAVAAAVLPARAAAREDVVAVLAGRRGDRRVRRRMPLLGLLVGVIGGAVALTASAGSASTTVILAGVALVEVGLIACTPALLSACSRLGRRSPLSARLALRDAGRNRSAGAPAVAAVMAAVIGAVALVIGVSSQEDRDRRQYTPLLPHHGVQVALTQETGIRAADDVANGLRATLPTSAVTVVRSVHDTCPAGVAICTLRTIGLGYRPDGPTQRKPVAVAGVPDVLVDDGTAVGVLTGSNNPDVGHALAAGRAVVADPTLVRDGTVELSVSDLTMDFSGGTGPTRTVRVPAYALPTGTPAAAQLVVPASLVTKYGAAIAPVSVVARETRAPTDAELQAATARLRRTIADPSIYVESGYRSRYGTLKLALVLAAVVIAVLAAVVATGLANVDGRADLATLGAIGASPRVRRRLSASRAGVIALIGTAIGVAAGPLVPAAWVLQTHRADAQFGSDSSSPALRLVLPWPSLFVLLVAIPAIAAVISGALTRSRLPSGAHG